MHLSGWGCGGKGTGDGRKDGIGLCRRAKEKTLVNPGKSTNIDRIRCKMAELPEKGGRKRGEIGCPRMPRRAELCRRDWWVVSRNGYKKQTGGAEPKDGFFTWEHGKNCKDRREKTKRVRAAYGSKLDMQEGEKVEGQRIYQTYSHNKNEERIFWGENMPRQRLSVSAAEKEPKKCCN